MTDTPLFEAPALRLTFEGTEFEGLEVRAWRLSIADVFELRKLRADVSDPLAAFARAPEVLGIMSRRLVSWNLARAGVPVPLTADALMDVDAALGIAVLSKMIGRLDVAPPLPRPSDSGDMSLEASMPMDVSSPNPTN